MKILYIVPKINNEGGVARVLSVKANYLIKKLGYEVHILTQNKGNFPLFYSFSKKIFFHDMILKGSYFQFINEYRKALKNKIKAISPDVILICDNGMKAYMIPFILKTKIPIIFESHGSIYIEEKQKHKFQFSTKLKLLFKDYSANKFTKFIALSNESLKEWNITNGVIIPNPLWFNTNQFSNLKSKRVIVVSRHSYEKGLDRMLKVWQKVIQKNPEWMLDIYVKPNDNREIQTLVNSLNIRGNVMFHEPVKNINDKYIESSILVMTSRTEGFGMVLIEAMACGLPVLAYDCPVGPRSIITNNENGFLIEDGNVNLFVEKLNLLIENENLRIEMGNKAKENSNRYNLDTIMLQWKNLFEGLIKD